MDMVTVDQDVAEETRVVAEVVHGFAAFPITVAARELTRQAQYITTWIR